MGRISGLLDALELYLRTHAEAAVQVGNYHRANLDRLKQLATLDERHARATERSVLNAEAMNDGVTVMIDHLKGIGPWMARIEQKVECAMGRVSPAEGDGTDG